MNWGQTKQNKRNIQSTRIIIIVDIVVHSLWLLLKLSFLSLNPLSPELDKVSFLLSISQTDFGKSLVKPRIKVGREYVNQGRNMQQVFFVNSSCKIHVLYEMLYLSQIHRTLKHYPWNVFENLLTQSNIYPKSLGSQVGMLETIWSCGYVVSGENFKTTSRSNFSPEFVYICTILSQEHVKKNFVA